MNGVAVVLAAGVVWWFVIDPAISIARDAWRRRHHDDQLT